MLLDILGIYLICSQNVFVVLYIHVNCFVSFTPLDFIPAYIFMHVALDILQRAASLG